jgi:hypothetical protein
MAEVDELYSVKTAYWLGNYEVRAVGDRWLTVPVARARWVALGPCGCSLTHAP